MCLVGQGGFWGGFFAPSWYAWLFAWGLRALAGFLLLGAATAALFVLVRVVKNAGALALGEWPKFTEVSVESKLIGVTLKQDAKRDDQLSTMNDRLQEIEARFETLDSKVSRISKKVSGGTGGK